MSIPATSLGGVSCVLEHRMHGHGYVITCTVTFSGVDVGQTDALDNDKDVCRTCICPPYIPD